MAPRWTAIGLWDEDQKVKRQYVLITDHEVEVNLTFLTKLHSLAIPICMNEGT
jgi:hypothetical protein